MKIHSFFHAESEAKHSSVDVETLFDFFQIMQWRYSIY